MDTVGLWTLFLSLLDFTINVLSQHPSCPRERCPDVRPSCQIQTTFIHNGIECDGCPLNACEGVESIRPRLERQRNRDSSRLERQRNRDSSRLEPQRTSDASRQGRQRNRDSSSRFRDRSRGPDSQSSRRDRWRQNDRSRNERQRSDHNSRGILPFPSDPFIREIPPPRRHRGSQERTTDPFPNNPDPSFFSDLPPRHDSGRERSRFGQRGRVSSRNRDSSSSTFPRNHDNTRPSRADQDLMPVRPVSPFDMTDILPGSARTRSLALISIRETNPQLSIEPPTSSPTSSPLASSGLAALLEGASASTGNESPLAGFPAVQHQTATSTDQQFTHSSSTNPPQQNSASQQQQSSAVPVNQQQQPSPNQVPNPALTSMPQTMPFMPNQIPFPMPNIFGIPFSPIQMQAVSALIAQMRLQTGFPRNQLIQPLGTQPAGTQTLGAQGLGTQSLGTQPLGTQPLGTQSIGTQTLGAQNLGTQSSLGTQALGAQNLGTQSLGTQTIGTQPLVAQPLATQLFGSALNPAIRQNPLMPFPNNLNTGALGLGRTNFLNPSQTILPQTQQANQGSTVSRAAATGTSSAPSAPISDEELHSLLSGVTSLDAEGQFVSNSGTPIDNSQTPDTRNQMPRNLVRQNAPPSVPRTPAFPNGNPIPTVPGSPARSSGSAQQTRDGGFPAFDLSVLFNPAANQGTKR